MEKTLGATPALAARHRAISVLLAVSDALAALMLAADLLVVCVSVALRYWFNAPVEWSDDVARGLMVGSSFFGAASALARGDNPGVRFFVDKMSVPYLSQATVDFVDSLEQTGFTIDNPAAQGGCACGNSFH